MNTAKVNNILMTMFRGSAMPEREKRMPWPKPEAGQNAQPLSHYHRVGSQWLYLEDQMQLWYGTPMYTYQAGGELVRSPRAKHSVFYNIAAPRIPLAEWRRRIKRENSAEVADHLRQPDFPDSLVSCTEKSRKP